MICRRRSLAQISGGKKGSSTDCQIGVRRRYGVLTISYVGPLSNPLARREPPETKSRKKEKKAQALKANGWAQANGWAETAAWRDHVASQLAAELAAKRIAAKQSIPGGTTVRVVRLRFHQYTLVTSMGEEERDCCSLFHIVCDMHATRMCSTCHVLV